jgi:PPOX class probable F420-dependent enzyme
MEPWAATAKYISLTTYRRDGTPVATPVWFVLDGDRLLVVTDADAGKVKRLRSNPSVAVAACDVRGRAKTPAVAGTARLLDDSIGPEVDRQLGRKHPLMKRPVELWYRVNRKIRKQPPTTSAYIEIRFN